ALAAVDRRLGDEGGVDLGAEGADLIELAGGGAVEGPLQAAGGRELGERLLGGERVGDAAGLVAGVGGRDGGGLGAEEVLVRHRRVSLHAASAADGEEKSRRRASAGARAGPLRSRGVRAIRAALPGRERSAGDKATIGTYRGPHRGRRSGRQAARRAREAARGGERG